MFESCRFCKNNAENVYLAEKIGVDTADNELSKVLQSHFIFIRSRDSIFTDAPRPWAGSGVVMTAPARGRNPEPDLSIPHNN